MVATAPIPNPHRRISIGHGSPEENVWQQKIREILDISGPPSLPARAKCDNVNPATSGQVDKSKKFPRRRTVCCDKVRPIPEHEEPHLQQSREVSKEAVQRMLNVKNPFLRNLIAESFEHEESTASLSHESSKGDELGMSMSSLEISPPSPIDRSRISDLTKNNVAAKGRTHAPRRSSCSDVLFECERHYSSEDEEYVPPKAIKVIHAQKYSPVSNGRPSCNDVSSNCMSPKSDYGQEHDRSDSSSDDKSPVQAAKANKNNLRNASCGAFPKNYSAKSFHVPEEKQPNANSTSCIDPPSTPLIFMRPSAPTRYMSPKSDYGQEHVISDKASYHESPVQAVHVNKFYSKHASCGASPKNYSPKVCLDAPAMPFPDAEDKKVNRPRFRRASCADASSTPLMFMSRSKERSTPKTTMLQDPFRSTPKTGTPNYSISTTHRDGAAEVPELPFNVKPKAWNRDTTEVKDKSEKPRDVFNRESRSLLHQQQYRSNAFETHKVERAIHRTSDFNGIMNDSKIQKVRRRASIDAPCRMHSVRVMHPSIDKGLECDEFRGGRPPISVIVCDKKASKMVDESEEGKAIKSQAKKSDRGNRAKNPFAYC